MDLGSPPEIQNLMAPGQPTWDGTSLPSLAVVTKTQKSHCPVISLQLLPKVFLLGSDYPPNLGSLEARSLCVPLAQPALSPGLGVAVLY